MDGIDDIGSSGSCAKETERCYNRFCVLVNVGPNSVQQKGTQRCGHRFGHVGLRRFHRHERIVSGLLEFGLGSVENSFIVM